MSNENNEERPKFEPQPLSRDQVDYAFELIDEIHPIEKYPIYDAFPYLKYVTSSCCYGIPFFKPYDRDGGAQVAEDQEGLMGAASEVNRQTTYTLNGKEYKKRSKKQKKKQVSDKASKEEPLAQLGFGIVAYTGMLYYMIWSFGLFSLIMTPAFLFYKNGTAYAGLKTAAVGYGAETLGNVGYSSTQCQSIPVDVDQITLSCDYGTIGTIFDEGVGVNPEASRGSCLVATQNGNSDCTPQASFITTMKAQVENMGYQEATVDITPDDLWGTTGKLSKAASCQDTQAFFFSQFTCIQSDTVLHNKYNAIATISALCILVAFLFTISLRHLYQGGKIQQLEWDMATITAGDYTVELKINPDGYRGWYNTEFRRPGGDFENGVSPAMSLKQHLIKTIEDQMTHDLRRSSLEESANGPRQQRNRGQKPALTEVKVADIVFSFNNTELILALRKRGQLIASQNFDKMREQEQVVNGLFEDFDKLTVPVSAFITFEEEDGKIIALRSNSEKQVLGQTLRLINASEPTDIIWENRHFTWIDYLKRQTFAFCVIFVLLLGSFIVVYIVASYSSKIASTYPQVDCDNIIDDYGTKLQSYAVLDYDFIQENPGQKSSGTLQCFCQQQCDIDSSTCKTESYGQTDGDDICAFYKSQVNINFLLVNGLSYVLTGINYVLRTACIMLIDWIGYGTETERLSKTTTVTFLVQFFNTAFLLLLVGANMSEQPITFWLTSGSFSDFNSLWFRTIGNTLVGTMWFNAWFPILESLGYFGLRILFRWLDGGCCNSDKYKTKKTSIQGYLDTYTGPVYLMHYKYSTLLNVVFVTFMYGLAMPILFPIAMLSIFILYFQEKLMLYYGYRVPPMYDERLSQNVLDRLQTAPILFLIFGYWMVGNQQLLSNTNLLARNNVDDVELSSHTMGIIIDNAGWCGFLWPILLSFILLFMLKCCGGWVGKKIEGCFPSLAIGDIEIDEDIDNYWATLDDEDRKWSQREEENTRRALNMPLMTETQFRDLMGTPKTKGKTLQGVHSYDILANPLYLDDFQYVTAAEDDRNDMIIDDDEDEGNDAAQSDFVRVALNLAYLTEKEARQFKFDKRQMDELRQAGEAKEQMRGNIAQTQSNDASMGQNMGSNYPLL